MLYLTTLSRNLELVSPPVTMNEDWSEITQPTLKYFVYNDNIYPFIYITSSHAED